MAGETTLDATTQPGYAGAPLIHIDGSEAGTGADGLVMAGEKGSIRGVAVTHFEGIGVVIADSEESHLTASYVGVMPDGQTAAGNGGHGVNLSRARSAVVGGTAVTDRNVISGNGGNGVYIVEVAARDNRIVGNFIGTDASGDVALPNGADGVSIENARGNEVGGQEAGATNLISGNYDDGVEIVGPGAVSNTVRANWIGTTRDGSVALANGDSGVLVEGAPNALVLGNVVAGNGGIGVEVTSGARGARVLGNYVGANPGVDDGLGNGSAGIGVLDASESEVGSLDSPNRVVGNAGPGILLAGTRTRQNTVTGNDVGRVGATERPNGGLGVVIRDAAAANLVASNRLADGIRIWGLGTDLNRVEGNHLTGARAHIGVTGIEVGHGARQTTVAANHVTLSSGHGLAVVGAGTEGTALAGNTITGSLRAAIFLDDGAGRVDWLPHANQPNRVTGSEGAGVEVHGAGHHVSNVIATDNAEGIALFGQGHHLSEFTVADNIGAGVAVHEGKGHRITGGRFLSNSGLGIDLGADGWTPNDPLDADDGPNDLVNHPEILALAVGATLGDGELEAGATLGYDGVASADLNLWLYASPTCDPSGYGEGAVPLTVVPARSDHDGRAHTAARALRLPADAAFLTATATILTRSAGVGRSCPGRRASAYRTVALAAPAPVAATGSRDRRGKNPSEGQASTPPIAE
jgi:titin